MDYTLSDKRFQFNGLVKILKSNILLCFVVLLLLIKIATASIGISFPHNVFFADITKGALEDMTNQSRQSLGLRPLEDNLSLDQAAQLKAEDMVQNQYFAHTSPTGVTPWFWFSKVGYLYQYAGENLAVGFYDSDQVYQAWLNSPEHKANLLNPNYQDTGIAVLPGLGQSATIVVVQLFGSTPPVSTPSKQTTQKPAAQPKETPIASVPATNSLAQQDNTDVATEKVLAQSTTSKIEPENSTIGTNQNLRAKIENYIIYDNQEILQAVLYGVFSFVIILLILLSFFSINVNFEKKTIIRSGLLVMLLIIALSLNRHIIEGIIPYHTVVI